MTNLIYSLLSHSWSGLLVAALVALLGWLITRAAPAVGRRWIHWLGLGLGLVGVLLGLGAAKAMWQVSRAMAQFPPPGRLIDVGGYRMHILAEGDAKGGPSVVWLTGSHEAGLWFNHVHKVMRQETRSILFDRPGSGWSDPGPYPRRTSREADELATLLERAGEKGPFVLVGHSYGGLLAANFARRYPARTAALVMADGTPPDVFMYLPDGGGPRIPGGIVSASRTSALMKLFGFGLTADPDAAASAADTSIARVIRTVSEQLTDVSGALRATAMTPDWATASIFEEWLDPKAVADLMVYDGELGDLPVFVVTPAGKARPEEVWAIGVSRGETERARHFLEQARMRYVRISSKSELIHTADGTGHNYPYETPDILIGVVRRALADSAIRARRGATP